MRSPALRLLLMQTLLLLLAFLGALLLPLAWAGTVCSPIAGLLSPNAEQFITLGATGVMFTGVPAFTSFVNGALGSYPTAGGTAPLSPQVMLFNSVNHADDDLALAAQTDLDCMYATALTKSNCTTIVDNAYNDGTTLAPGCYDTGNGLLLTGGSVILDGGGDADAAFLFRIGSTLTTASNVAIALTNGAQSCNVFWVVGSSATLGTGTTFRGTILAAASITLVTGSTVDGRLLSMNGAVTLDGNTIRMPEGTSATATQLGYSYADAYAGVTECHSYAGVTECHSYAAGVTDSYAYAAGVTDSYAYYACAYAHGHGHARASKHRQL